MSSVTCTLESLCSDVASVTLATVSSSVTSSTGTLSGSGAEGGTGANLAALAI